MAIAAVPNYLQKDDPEFYLSAPPGHRFLLYFAAWGENQETQQVDWRMKDRVPKMEREKGGKQLIQKGWDDIPNDQYAATISAGKPPAYDEYRPRKRKSKADQGLKPWLPLMSALLNRQNAAFGADSTSKEKFVFDALATAPFTTGLGNEHPLENGFAFLNPYGLPYLPGSGVKGVLRQAARELAKGEWGETHGWDEGRYQKTPDDNDDWVFPVIDALFGKEDSNNAQRGALTFWDVIPQIKDNHLAVEIMTPHYGHYYQPKKDERGSPITASPHDSGNPVPITFLTVPPGSGFTFYVQCNLTLLQHSAPELAQNEQWKELLQAAFKRAFDWLGFGAKTAVGYGAMEPKAMREEREKKAAIQREAERKAEKQKQREQAEANAETWEGARIKYNRANNSLSVEKSGKTAIALAPLGGQLLASLPDDIRKKVETNQFVKVTARISGNDLLEVSR